MCRLIASSLMAMLLLVPTAPAQDLDFRLIARPSPSAYETTTQLPDSLASVTVGDTYYVEFWVSDVGSLNTGVTSAYIDVSWPASLATAHNVDHGSLYIVFPSGTIAPGFLDELGGSTFNVVGIEPQWARVAVIEVTADAEGAITYTASPSDTGAAAYGRGVIPWGQIALYPAVLAHEPDCNHNGVPDSQDIANGTSEDCNENGVPDECDIDTEPAQDCNANGIVDACDITAGTSLDCNFNGIPDECDVLSWAAYDPGAHGVGTDPDGFVGGVFDGRYVYFAPHYNGNEYDGEVLRYDTAGAFADPGSWATFDPGANGVGSDPDGYWGGVFDGRYVYFAPFYNDGNLPHGEVLRYDTTGAFSTAASWLTYTPGDHEVGVDPVGYAGGVFDGRYVYFAPFQNHTGPSGEVLRYDTSGDFLSRESWLTFDAAAHGLGANLRGYIEAVFDGRYVYFAPWRYGTESNGEVLRYDTFGVFTDLSSWGFFDAGAHGVGFNPRGYEGAIFDGRYVYFVPNFNGFEYHSEVLRYDTTGAFIDPYAWTTFDPRAYGVGVDPRGFVGGVFDGRYVWFVPAERWDGVAHGEVLRFDTSGSFANPSSWVTFIPRAHGVGTNPAGYRDAIFDGRYIYFVPWHNGTDYHGEVLRCDTFGGGSFDCNVNGVPDDCDIAGGASHDANGNGIPDGLHRGVSGLRHQQRRHQL
jgi:hypothetical protein